VLAVAVVVAPAQTVPPVITPPVVFSNVETSLTPNIPTGIVSVEVALPVLIQAVDSILSANVPSPSKSNSGADAGWKIVAVPGAGVTDIFPPWQLEAHAGPPV